MCHLSKVIITDCTIIIIITIIIITIMMKRWGLRVIWCLIDASRTHNLGTGKNHPCTYSSSWFNKISKRSGCNHRARRAKNSLAMAVAVYCSGRHSVWNFYSQGFSALVSDSETNRLVWGDFKSFRIFTDSPSLWFNVSDHNLKITFNFYLFFLQNSKFGPVRTKQLGTAQHNRHIGYW